MKHGEHRQAFVETIWQWYAVHKRQLPWRDLGELSGSQRAYQVLVSEIMLQQTQVSRVIPLYTQFLRRYPGLADLADATNAEVILAWRGLGYNSRALRLRDAARLIEEEYKGEFPKDLAELLSIKGIGSYTAAAIRNFAFQLPTPCLDTNIRRILHRCFIGPERPDGTWKEGDARLLVLAEELLEYAVQHPAYTTADWHAALMDYGSMVCTKRRPRWDACPLTAKGLCKAAYRVRVDPIKRKKKPEPGREMGGRYIPNRIFRGRIIEELRDSGLSFTEIGARICLDWSPQHHEQWLSGLLCQLEKERFIQVRDGEYGLAD